MNSHNAKTNAVMSGIQNLHPKNAAPNTDEAYRGLG